MVAKTVESTVQTETLSKQHLQNVENILNMVSTNSRDMAPKGLNQNAITNIAKAITDQKVMVVNIVTVFHLINQKCLARKRML